MQNPFDGFQQGLMTGATLGGRMRQNQQRREVGGMLENGDYGGAARTAYGQGDLQTGAVLTQVDQRNQATARNTQITGALKTGDYAGAMTFASSPEELQAITEFRSSATEAQREQAVLQATNLASVIEAVQALPAEQQLAAAQQYAPQFGVDATKITPETLQQLPALRVQALGLKDYLTYQQEERAAQRPIFGNGFVSLPPGAELPGAQPEVLSALPEGARIRPRPDQPSSAPAAGGGERSQTPRVSFQSSNEARQSVAQLVPGVRVTNADRTPADTARIRRQGYNPSDTSFHLRGQALDLTPPAGMSMGQLEAKMRQAGFRVLNEGHHIHVSW